MHKYKHIATLLQLLAASRQVDLEPETEWLPAGTDLCKEGSSSLSCSGSLVLGITPMMVLFSEVPFSTLLLTSCMFLAESTLILIVEPGKTTPS